MQISEEADPLKQSAAMYPIEGGSETVLARFADDFMINIWVFSFSYSVTQLSTGHLTSNPG